jgi:hypothetical protein
MPRFLEVLLTVSKQEAQALRLALSVAMMARIAGSMTQRFQRQEQARLVQKVESTE